MPDSGDWRRDAEEVLQGCQRVRRFIAGMCFESFAGDERAREVVRGDLEAIGAAARNLTASMPEAARRKLGLVPALPAQGDSGLDARLVWGTATTTLDELEQAVRKLLG